MKYVRQKRFRCIQEEDAQSFENAMNELFELASDPEIKYDDNRSYTAYVVYTYEANVAETLADEYELAGKGRTCGECPYLERDNHMTKKVFPCKYSKYGRTRIDMNACDRYYVEFAEELEG